MTDDQVRALLIVGALWTVGWGSAGFVGGRVTAPVPPVRYVTVEVPAAVAAPPPADVAPTEAPAIVPPADESVAVAPIEPPAAAPVEVKPAVPPRPKVDAKPKEQPKPKARPPALKKSLPSCAVIKREYETMSWAQQMAAYRRATPEEIAHGKRCLGL